jgi:signal transduction histidine kinase
MGHASSDPEFSCIEDSNGPISRVSEIRSPRGTLLAMPAPDSLMPHAVCWASSPQLIWTMVITNLVTFLSYAIICITLFYLAKNTHRVMSREWGYFTIGFALFIVACGFTHLFEVITTWIPVFWTSAWVSVLTALLSAYVAAMLIRRARTIAFGINDYAERLSRTETESLQMQESLIANQKLEEWSRMSAAVSHEIMGPLQAIQNLQFLIQSSDSVTPEIAEFARVSADEAARVVTISEASLSYIRQSKQLEAVDIAAALASVQILLHPLIRQKNILFTVRNQGDSVVLAYAGEVRQVLLNLLRNACEAVPPSGAQVTIELNGKLEDVEIIVTDNGPGIPPSILPELFAFGVTTKPHTGNGIGLWAVKHILSKHGGKIAVDSSPGKGVRFDLCWPRAH